MDLIKIKDGVKTIVLKSCSEEDFQKLIIQSKKKFGLKSVTNPLGFAWPDARIMEFHCNNITFKLVTSID